MRDAELSASRVPIGSRSVPVADPVLARLSRSARGDSLLASDTLETRV